VKTAILSALAALFIPVSLHAKTLSKAEISALQTAPRARGAAKDFFVTLDRLLKEFEWDLRDNKVEGLRDAAVRNIAATPNIPQSFAKHLEQFVIERVRKDDPKVRMVRCDECRARKSEFRDGKVVITDPRADLKLQAEITNELGIEHFIDLAFDLQRSKMSLTFFITRAEDGSIVWEKAYDTDNLTQREEVSEVEQFAEYEPRISHRPFVSFMFLPIEGSYLSTLELGWRMTQRAFNRYHDLGFQVSYNLTSTLLTGATQTSTNTYGVFNLTLLLMYGYTLIGSYEDFDQPRFGITAGVGAAMSNLNIMADFRGGLEGRLGKHWAVHALFGYRPNAVAIVGTNTANLSGFEFGGGASFLF
jgi:hypothetical protein